MSNIPNKPNQKPYKDLTPFDLVLIQKFPFIEEDFDAINIYGIISKIKDKLNEVIANEQIVTENQESLYNSFVDLRNYVEDYFTNLDVQEEINNKIDEMVESGVFDEIVSKYVKIKPFEFCKALNIIKNRATEELYTLNEIQTKINEWKSAKIKKVCLTVEIQPSATDQIAFENGTKNFNEIDIRMYPNQEVLNEYIELCKNNNIEIYDLKFHLTWIHQKCNSVNLSTKAERYINVVNSVLSEMTHSFEYISVFNEWAEMLQYSGVQDFLNNVKNYSKVLLSGIFEESITDELLEIIDGYCPHFYIKSSRLGPDTTLEFLINMFEESYQYQSLRKWQLRSNKPIIVGECGCMSYWNALAFPMQWEHTGQLVENGAPQVLYIKALLHIFKKWNVTDCNYWWDIYGNAYDIIKEWEVNGNE